MRKLKETLVIMVALILAISDIVQAGDSASIRIGCTIPAIPGVNVPLIEENVKSEAIELDVEKDLPTSPQEVPSDSAAMFQKDSEEVRLIQGEKINLAVETIYSR